MQISQLDMFDCQRVTVCCLRFGRNQWVQDLSDWKCNLDPGTLEATRGFHVRSFAPLFLYPSASHMASWENLKRMVVYSSTKIVYEDYPAMLPEAIQRDPRFDPGHPGHCSPWIANANPAGILMTWTCPSSSFPWHVLLAPMCCLPPCFWEKKQGMEDSY